MFDVISSTNTVLNPQFNDAINRLLANLLELALLALSTLAAIGIKKWKDSLNSAWKRALAERAVKYAQQRFTDNAEKRHEAAQLLAEKFPRISEAEIEHLLEEAVFNMKQEMTASVAIAMEPSVATSSAALEAGPQ